MQRLLAVVLFGSFVSLAVAAEIDDSSYESLFKTAYQTEMQNGLTQETLEALLRFDALDLISHVEPSYRSKAPSETSRARQRVADDVHIVAERLFRAGRIDEGMNFLKIMLPPQEPTDGMFVAGYVSDFRAASIADFQPTRYHYAIHQKRI